VARRTGDAATLTPYRSSSRSPMTGELPANDTPTCGLSRVCGHVSWVQQNDPGSALASTIRTCRPAFCRYAAAGRPPDSPPPTTITSTARASPVDLQPAACPPDGRLAALSSPPIAPLSSPPPPGDPPPTSPSPFMAP